MTEAPSPGEPAGRAPSAQVGGIFTLRVRRRTGEIASAARRLHDLNPPHPPLRAV